MKADRVLAIRRAVNQQRKAGHTEKAIARWLTAARLVPPLGEAWRRAGVGPTWSAQGVTRFMECTRHVRPAPKVTATAPAEATPRLRVRGVKAATIFTSAPDPARIICFP